MAVTSTRLGIIQGCQKLLRLTASKTLYPVDGITSFVSKLLETAFPKRIHEKILQRKVVSLKAKIEKISSETSGTDLVATNTSSVKDSSSSERERIESLQDALQEACRKKEMNLSKGSARQVEGSPAPLADALSKSIFDGQIKKGRLSRLDDQMWAYTAPEGVDSSLEEIRIQIPKTHTGKEAYELVQTISSVFDEKIARLRESVLKAGINIPIDVENQALAGTWHIGISTPKGVVRKTLAWLSDTVSQSIPFTQTLKDRKIVVVDVEKVPDVKKVSDVALPILAPQEKPHAIGGTSFDVLSSDMREQLTSESFQDPFTRLATECFQKYESFFVMEAEHRGSYRFVMDNEGKVRLEENKLTQKGYADENRTVVAAYAEFLKREYGSSFVSQLEKSFNISFDRMICEGLPLLPDHVSKCNIGVNSIEDRHIEHLNKKLQAVLSQLQKESMDLSWKERKALPAVDFLKQLPMEKGDSFVSVRAVRGLLRSIPKERPTLEDLFAHLTKLLGDERKKARDLHPEAFNTIVSMIMPTDGALDRAFTGRKIRHLAVMGCNTMGKSSTPNPCRDQFELLHVFSDCRKTKDWKSYYELLSHVIVKKNLFRKTPNTENSWHVGLLIPAPASESGEARWYRNDAFSDDHKGNVNYVLLPACQQYRTADGRSLPMIKVYRNTCFGGVDWQDSVAADLNPYGSPQSLNPDASSKYEQPYIHERTIPLWMGYLISARQMDRSSEESGEKYHERIMKAADEFLTCIKKEQLEGRWIQQEIDQLIERGDLEALQEALTKFGHYFKEDPQYKIAQEMVFAGHSLGGALAQFGTWSFLASKNRLPLPGNDVTCYASNSPGIDTQADADFMRFGHEHRDVLADLKTHTKIIYQFEYGDFVPQSGNCLLGTTDYDENKDTSWMGFSASIFRPTEATRVHSLVAPTSTHLRRIGAAREDTDYTSTLLSPKDLWDFHHTVFLRGKIGKAFGYKVLRCPRVTEVIRQDIGVRTRLPLKIYQWWLGNQVGVRDANGVFAIDGRHSQK